MTVGVRAASRADLPGLLALYAELNPDDPPLSERAADRIVLPDLTRGGRGILGVENVVVGRAHRSICTLEPDGEPEGVNQVIRRRRRTRRSPSAGSVDVLRRPSRPGRW